MKTGAARAFSLIEVTLALAIFAFALTVVVALLPIGIRSNRTSVDENRALGLLTALDTDLRNSHPLLNGGTSAVFGLPLPYALDANGNYIVNLKVVSTTPPPLPASYTTSVNDDGSHAATGGRYQVTVVYTSVPQSVAATSASLAPVEARLIVNWPVIASTNVADLSNPAKVTFVDTYVSFPCP